MTDTWVIEGGGEVSALVGEVLPYTVTFLGASSVSAVVSVTVYQGSSDVTSTTMITGDSNSASGTTVTLKKITMLDAHKGKKLKVVVLATVDGSTQGTHFQIFVVDPKGAQ